MAFGVVLFVASWGIIRESLFILMEGAPRGIDLQVVARTLDKLPHLVGAHHFHAWTLTSDKHVFSAHLRIDAHRMRRLSCVRRMSCSASGLASTFRHYR